MSQEGDIVAAWGQKQLLTHLLKGQSRMVMLPGGMCVVSGAMLAIAPEATPCVSLRPAPLSAALLAVDDACGSCDRVMF
jgi:hypothetical protein